MSFNAADVRRESVGAGHTEDTDGLGPFGTIAPAQVHESQRVRSESAAPTDQEYRRNSLAPRSHVENGLICANEFQRGGPGAKIKRRIAVADLAEVVLPFRYKDAIIFFERTRNVRSVVVHAIPNGAVVPDVGASRGASTIRKGQPCNRTPHREDLAAIHHCRAA